MIGYNEIEQQCERLTAELKKIEDGSLYREVIQLRRENEAYRSIIVKFAECPVGRTDDLFQIQIQACELLISQDEAKAALAAEDGK